MTNAIRRVFIGGLHDDKDVDFGLNSNISIFMGPNGIGKSTILNILVHCLARQWQRLGKQPFRTVRIDFMGGQSVEVQRADCLDTYSGDLSPRFQNISQALLENGLLEDVLSRDVHDDEWLAQFATSIEILPRDLRIFKNTILHSEQGGRSISALSSAAKIIKTHFRQRILYLPTYRRIEQDLNEILSANSPTSLRRIRAEIGEIQPSVSNMYTELVRFGMDDIDRLIQSYTSEVKEYSRQQINSLSTRYLTAALRVRQVFDRAFFDNVSDSRIRDVLGRVDDEELNATQRSGISDLIKSLRKRQGGGRLSRSQEHIAGYFSMLAETHDRISVRERPLQNLAALLNKYVGPTKVAAYDPTKYQFSIRSGEKDIPLAGLSSGEKQIVSLFATLTLTRDTDYFVVIDEPELSLSVLWQELLLGDILSTHSCSDLLAVTHSPFIYGEKLSIHTRDLSDYTKGIV